MKGKESENLPRDPLALEVSWFWTQLLKFQRSIPEIRMLTAVGSSNILQNKTWLRFYEIAMGLVGFLRQHGVGKGAIVAVDANFRCEILSLWCACQYLGAVTLFFPLDMRLKDKISDCQSLGAKILFVDGPDRAKAWLEGSHEPIDLEAMVYLDVKAADGMLIDRLLGWPLPEQLSSFESVVERGARGNLNFEPQKLDKDATIAMTYSQGRTGRERRISLTASVAKHQAIALKKWLKSKTNERVLIDLRSIHACNLAVFAYCLHEGMGLVFAYSEKVDWLKIIAEAEVDYAFFLPTHMAQLSKLLAESHTGGILSGQWKRLSLAAAKFRNRNEGAMLAWSKPLINSVFLQQYKQKLGNFKAIISYGNRFETRLAERFTYLDIKVYNAYTVAEAAGFAHMHQYLDQGCFLEALETRIKHGVLSLRYRQNNAKYASTGDLVFIDGRGGIFVRRVHEITLEDGTVVETSMLSDAIMREKLIEDIFIFGQEKAFLTALIYLRTDALKAWAQQNKIPNLGETSLTQHPKVYAYVKAHVDACNLMRGSKEAIGKIALIPRPLSEDTRVLTPCKLTRHHEVERRYAALLQSFYDDAF